MLKDPVRGLPRTGFALLKLIHYMKFLSRGAHEHTVAIA